MSGIRNFFAHGTAFTQEFLPLTYLAHRLTDGEPYENIAWCLFVTESVSLITFELLSQVYAHRKLCQISSWTFTCIVELSDIISGCLGRARNVKDRQALLDHETMVFPVGLSWTAYPCGTPRKPLTIFSGRKAEYTSIFGWKRC